MQTRDRGVVMVVAAGCMEKTTRRSSVVVDIGVNSDGSDGGCVSTVARPLKVLSTVVSCFPLP